MAELRASDVGPLINADGRAKVEEHVKDALAKGAKAICGGHTHEAGPHFTVPLCL